MKNKLHIIKSIILCLSVSFGLNLISIAQNDKTTTDTPATAEKKKPAENKAKPKENRINEKLRLTGEWEVFFDGNPTGVLLDLRQVTNRVHGIYGDIAENKELGISKGLEFFQATVTGATAKGQVIIRQPSDDGKTIEKIIAPFSFNITENGENLDCEIAGDKVEESEQKFSLKPTAKVKKLNLFVKTPDGYQPCNKIIEMMPMIVEAELTSPTLKAIPITIKADEHELKLNATYVSQKKVTGQPFRIIARTEIFLPTYGNQLGVPQSPELKKEEWGREPLGNEWKQLQGVWRTAYMDQKLGKINGWVEITKRSSNFKYKDVKNNTWRELGLAKAGILPATEDLPLRWKFKFEGRGVVSEKVESIKEREA